MSRGGAERKRERQTESEAGSRLWAVSTDPDVGLKPTDCEIMTWAEVGCSTDWATQAPHFFSIFIFEREREREREREMQNVSRGGAKRGRQNQKQAPGPELSAQSLMWGSNSRVWDHDMSQNQTLKQLSHPGASINWNSWGTWLYNLRSHVPTPMASGGKAVWLIAPWGSHHEWKE